MVLYATVRKWKESAHGPERSVHKQVVQYMVRYSCSTQLPCRERMCGGNTSAFIMVNWRRREPLASVEKKTF